MDPNWWEEVSLFSSSIGLCLLNISYCVNEYSRVQGSLDRIGYTLIHMDVVSICFRQDAVSVVGDYSVLLRGEGVE